MNASYPPSLRVLRSDNTAVSLPTIYTAHDLYGDTSAGTGFGRSGLTAAVGEHIERSYFRTMVPTSSKLTLAEMGFGLGDSYSLALLQANSSMNTEITGHRFETVPAVSLVTGSIEHVPRVIVALDNNADREFFPYGDTTGCAMHVDSRACLVGALREFAERQATLASWIGPWPAIEIEMSGRRDGLITFFTDRGRLRVFDIGASTRMPVILAVFQADDPTAAVQFACGLGAHTIGSQAIEKSLLELFQLFELTRFVAIGEVKDERGLLQFNRADMLSEWPFIAAGKEHLVSLDDYCRVPPVDIAAVIAAFRAMGVELIYFTDHREIGETSLFFGRVFSPNAFLCSMEHIRNNWNNTFSVFHGLDLERARNFPCPLF